MGSKPQNLALAWWVLSSASLLALMLRLAWDAPVGFFFVASTALVLSGAYVAWGTKSQNKQP